MNGAPEATYPAPPPTEPPEPGEAAVSVDDARAWKGPTTLAPLTLHREDMLAAQLFDLRAVVEGQKVIIAKAQVEDLKRKQTDELRAFVAAQRQQLGFAEAEVAMIAEGAKGAEAATRAAWKDLSAIYKVDFDTHSFDDESGVILRAGEPVHPTSE